MKIKKKAKIWLRTLTYYLYSITANRNANILTSKETVDLALNTKKSIIRLGDGEFNILNGKSIHYQKYSKELSNQLQHVINEYLEKPKETGYLLCMPREYIKPNGMKFLLNRKLVSSWAYTRYTFKKKYDVEIDYGNSFIFADGNEPLYSRFWQQSNIDRIIFVHNNSLYGQNFKIKYGVETISILIPEKNSFESVDNIYRNILEHIKDVDKTLVLVSAGPSAKILVWKLTKVNIWAIDTGHCWDDPLIIF